jgi:hypothetical protein
VVGEPPDPADADVGIMADYRAVPDDKTHLENNDFAKNNDGGAPANNDNAAIHHGFSEWRTAYERFQRNPDARERIEMFVSAYLATASEHADDLERGRRERLARELATRRLLKQRAQADVWNDGDSDADTDARGLLLEDGDGGTVNPAHIAAHKLKQRTPEIAEELSLWSGFQ